MTANFSAVRAIPDRSLDNSLCWRCHRETETLTHSLGSCPYGELLQNTRHHRIWSEISDILQEERLHGIWRASWSNDNWQSSQNWHNIYQGKFATLAQMVACLPLVQQVWGSIPGWVVNFYLKIFNLGARRGGDVHFLIARLYITGLD